MTDPDWKKRFDQAVTADVAAEEKARQKLEHDQKKQAETTEALEKWSNSTLRPALDDVARHINAAGRVHVEVLLGTIGLAVSRKKPKVELNRPVGLNQVVDQPKILFHKVFTTGGVVIARQVGSKQIEPETTTPEQLTYDRVCQIAGDFVTDLIEDKP